MSILKYLQRKILSIRLLLIGLISLALLTLTAFHSRAASLASTFNVTNINDSGPGSLRQAILDANGMPGHDTIVFDMSSSTETQVIAVQTVLPPITDSVTIDGTSQPGYSSGNPSVEITGRAMNLDFPVCEGPANGHYRDNAGLDIRKDPFSSIDASGTIILGLKISDFCQGVSVSGMVSPRDDGTSYACQDVDDDPDVNHEEGKITDVTIQDNVIEGNDQGNAALDLCNAQHSLIQGNYLDNESDNIEVAHSEYVSVIGNTALNGKDGVSLVESFFITIQENELISTSTGIHMKFGAADNTILNNVITDVSRFGLALSNNNLVRHNIITGSGWFGIEIRGGNNNILEGNILTDNGYSREEPIFAGIVIGAGSRRPLGVNCSVNELGEPFGCEQDAEWNPLHQGGSFDNVVRGNLIANNNGPGILVGGVFNKWVPGTDASDWDPEVKAFIGDTVYSSQNNSLLDNTIYGNMGLGIDLSDETQFLYHDLPEPFAAYYIEIQAAAPDGLTPNDSGNFANSGQNYPLLTSALATPSQLIVRGTIDALDPQSLTIEIYANPEDDPSGHGEGATLLGKATPNMQGEFTTHLPPVLEGMLITATATNVEGNTSEYAENIEATLGMSLFLPIVTASGSNH